MITVNNVRIFHFWSTILLWPDLWVKNHLKDLTQKNVSFMNHSPHLLSLRRARMDVKVFSKWVATAEVCAWPLGVKIHKSSIWDALQKPKHPTIPHLPFESSGLSPSDSLQVAGTQPHVSNVLLQSQTAWKQLEETSCTQGGLTHSQRSGTLCQQCSQAEE